MAIVRNHMGRVVSLGLVLVAGGCGLFQDDGSWTGPDRAADRTAVESALQLSQRYAQLSDEVAAVRERNRSLVDENERLRSQAARLNSELEKTKTELNEANALLIEMLGELEAWKKNILEFRDEMRNASKAQLEALLKVLEVLEKQASAAPPVNDPLSMSGLIGHLSTDPNEPAPSQ